VAKLCSAMAHLAQHRIELTEQERVELTRRAPAEKLPFQEVQRARIVLTPVRGWRTRRSPGGWIRPRGSWGSGEDGATPPLRRRPAGC
jgi:hypothetical protein